jgi:hypothetical protein
MGSHKRGRVRDHNGGQGLREHSEWPRLCLTWPRPCLISVTCKPCCSGGYKDLQDVCSTVLIPVLSGTRVPNQPTQIVHATSLCSIISDTSPPASSPQQVGSLPLLQLSSSIDAGMPQVRPINMETLNKIAQESPCPAISINAHLPCPHCLKDGSLLITSITPCRDMPQSLLRIDE